MWPISIYLLLLTILLVWIWTHPTSKGRLPPGPRPLPFLGNILQIDPNGFLKSFQELQQRYRDIFTLYLGPHAVVVLCGYEAMREALVDQAEAFSGRGLIAITEPIFQGTGVVFANGKPWKVLRKFCVTTMKDFGMGKRSIEERIKEEAQCLIKEIQKSQGASMDLSILFRSVTSNIICSIIFGERFHYQDPKFLRLLNLLNDCFIILSSFYGQVFELLSGILKHLPGPHAHMYRKVQEVKDFINQSVERHQATLDPSAPPEISLTASCSERLVPDSEFNHKNLINTVLSLFFAGTETSSTTLCYALLLLLKHPHVLEKVQVEIDRVIGRHRLPSLVDRAKMPYTDAVIHEVQRFSDLSPIGVPHCVIQDTHFRGYHIPKDTTVYPVMSSVLHDPHHFEKPDTFHPAHFLDEKGGFRKREAFTVFSMVKWKRICFGESLARSELFLFLTSVLQNFSLRSPQAPEDIDLTPKVSGLGKLPPAFQLCFLPRPTEKEGMQTPSASSQPAPSPAENRSVQVS